MSPQTKPEPTTGAEIVPLRQREPLPDDVVLAIAAGNLAPLEPRMRAIAIRTICEDGNLPLSLSPVILIPGDGGVLKPYVTSIGASWVADNKRVSTKILGTETAGGVYVVRMMAVAGDGRSVEDIGAVAVQGLAGQFLANAYMKAHTKAYRRTVLRLAGLPLTDDDEGSGPPRRIDYDTGEIIEAAGTIVSSDPSPSPQKHSANDDPRAIAARHLFATIREVYGKSEPISDIGHDLVCTRYGLASTKDATEEQLRAVADAVKAWSYEDAVKAWQHIRLVAGAETETMLVDVVAHFDEIGVTSPFVRDALAEQLRRIEEKRTTAAPNMAETDALVAAATVGVEGP
jgi:hypothetical protein